MQDCVPPITTPSSPGGSAQGVANVTNSIIKGKDTVGSGNNDIKADANTGAALVNADYSSYTNVITENGGTVTPPGSGTNITGDPLFTNISGNDFTLQNGSSSIDRGDPLVVQPGELDLAGNQRSQAFFLECEVIPDLGAYEKSGTPSACPAGDTIAPPPTTPSPSDTSDTTPPKLIVYKGKIKIKKNGIAPVKVKCPANEPEDCKGTLTLQIKKKSKGKNRTSRKQRKSRQVAIGSKSFTVKPGESTTINIKLKTKYKNMVKLEKRLKARAVAIAVDSAGNRGTSSAKVTLIWKKSR